MGCTSSFVLVGGRAGGRAGGHQSCKWGQIKIKRGGGHLDGAPDAPRDARQKNGRGDKRSSPLSWPPPPPPSGEGERESIRFRGRGEGEQGEYKAGEVITEYIHPPRCHSNAHDKEQQRTTTDARANQV